MTRSFKTLLGERGPRRTIKLALAALLLCDLLFYLFAIGPLAQSDRERRQQVESLRKLVRDRTVAVDRLAARVQKIQTARSQGDELLENITIPRRTVFSTVISELDEAGKKAGITLKDRTQNVEPIEGSDTLSMLTINQGLEGSYENLVKFLNLLDRSQRFVIVESLGAAPQQTGQQQAQQASALLSVTLRVDAFVRDET